MLGCLGFMDLLAVFCCDNVEWWFWLVVVKLLFLDVGGRYILVMVAMTGSWQNILVIVYGFSSWNGKYSLLNKGLEPPPQYYYCT